VGQGCSGLVWFASSGCIADDGTWIHIGPIGSGDPPAWDKAPGLVECEVQPGSNDQTAYENSFGVITRACTDGSARRATVFGFQSEDISHSDKVEFHSMQYVVTEPDSKTGDLFVFAYSDASNKGSYKPFWPPGAHNVLTAQVDVAVGGFTSFSESVIRSSNLTSHSFAIATYAADPASGNLLTGTVGIGSNGLYEARIHLT
jgi:hypothetical protein